MEKLDFSGKFIKLIMECVSSISFFCVGQWSARRCVLSKEGFETT